jgi:hypothetical protein
VRRRWIEERIDEVEAELAALEPKVIADDGDPARWLRPALDGEAGVDA